MPFKLTSTPYSRMRKEKEGMKLKESRTIIVEKEDGRQRREREPTCKGLEKVKALIDRNGAPALELSHIVASLPKTDKEKEGQISRSKCPEIYLFDVWNRSP